ncbi:MAG: hypothetical protein U0T74_15330 [Chitinophagales bacterium]
MLLFIHLSLYILYLSAFLWLIKRSHFFDIQSVSRFQLGIFFLIKVAAGILLTVVYTYYYTDRTHNDIYRYFNDSVVISSVLFKNPSAWIKIMLDAGLEHPETFQYLIPTQNFSHSSLDMITNNSLIIRLNVLLNYASHYNIWINTLFFDFFSFAGMVALYKTLQPYFKPLPNALSIPIFLIPSVVFWSSGLLKESMYFMCFGFWLHSFLWLTQGRKKARDIIVLFVTSWLILSIKIQFFAILFISAYFFLLISSVGLKRWAGIALLLFFTLIAWYGHFMTFICEVISYKRTEFILLANAQNAGSLIPLNQLATDCLELFYEIPSGFINAVFRPFIWEYKNLFQLIFCFENLFFLLAIMFVLIRFFKYPQGVKKHLFVFFFLFSILNYLVIGLTVPIEGAIVHYRVVATPSLFISALLVIDLEKLKGFVYAVLQLRYGQE